MENILISLMLCSLLAGFALYKKALTNVGTFIAWVLSIIITYCGGLVGFVILLTVFMATIIIGKIFNKKRETILKNTNQKNGKRDSIQILANVGFGTISLLIYYFTKNEIYLITYACVMASSLADSMASELGVLSKKDPIDICTFKRIDKGISGGVTIFGLVSSMLGSLIIAMTFYLMNNNNLKILLFIVIAGFSGSLIDSALGSLFQVKYKCQKCNKITEKKEHCDNRTLYFKGIKIINNDIVNIINNFSVFVLSILLLSQNLS